MTSFARFHPFSISRRSERSVPDMEIEPRPGLEPEDDIFDQPYRFDQPDQPREETELEEIISEYHHSNMTFWWFIIGAGVLAFFLYLVEFHISGVDSRWYKDLKKFPGSPSPIVIMLGNTFLALMLAWSAYHIFKSNSSNNPENKTPKVIRYSGIFLLVGIYITVLIWALVLYTTRRPRNAALFIFVAAIMIIAFIVLSYWNIPDNEMLLLPLVLSFFWVAYLLYYTVGIINENPESVFGDFSDVNNIPDIDRREERYYDRDSYKHFRNHPRYKR